MICNSNVTLCNPYVTHYFGCRFVVIAVQNDDFYSWCVSCNPIFATITTIFFGLAINLPP